VNAEAVLKKVQEHPDAWTRVDSILEKSGNQQTKFYGLQVRLCLIFFLTSPSVPVSFTVWIISWVAVCIA